MGFKAAPQSDHLLKLVYQFSIAACVSLQSLLTCGKAETHDYQLYLAFNDIEHTKTQVRHPQTNGICERFHKTILQEFYQVAFRRKIYRSIDELQADLDEWLVYYNNDRTHQGKMCCGRTPMQTLIDGKEAWHDKITTLND